MATVTRGYSFGSTEQVTNTKLHTLVDSATVTSITNADVDAGAAISDTKLDLATIAQAMQFNGAVTAASIFKLAKGADVASANGAITLGDDGNYFDITGTNAITSITAKTAGTVVILQFDSTATLTDGSNLKLAGNFTGAAEAQICLVSDGTNWFEVSRNNASSGGVPTNYRSQMYVMQASTTTMTVAPGVLEVNGVSISKTSNTTLTVGTAGDWAGGSSLRATSTTAYVGVDASGNIKMHTTAPTHADYALSVTAANNTKRYASWSSTTYRIIGWFYMNGTGSGELDTFGVSNIADGSVKNIVRREYVAYASGTTTIPGDDTIPQNTEGDQYMTINSVFTNVNNKIKVRVIAKHGGAAGTVHFATLFKNSGADAIEVTGFYNTSTSAITPMVMDYEAKATSTGLTTFNYRAGARTVDTGTTSFNGNNALGGREFGGALISMIEVEEIESQLT